MLVLTRNRHENIVIDDRIVVTVVEIRGDKVRLGITAPKEVPVHRQEVHEALARDLRVVASSSVLPCRDGVEQPTAAR